jgi:recombination protein RecT
MGTTIARYDDIRRFLTEEQRQANLAKVCAGRIDVARQIELAVLCCYGQPKLLQCTKASIAASVLEASDLGLSLSRSGGEAYLIPRRNKQEVLECHFMAGYQGLIKLAREAGTHYVHARSVCTNDEFEWGWTPELEFVHRLQRGRARGAIELVYAVALLDSGELLGQVMEVDEVQAIRSRSQRPKEGPWVTDWESMAWKTVIRQLAKFLPKTPRFERAIESHDADFDFETPALTFAGTSAKEDVIPPAESPELPQIAAETPVESAPPPPTKAHRLTAILAARAAGKSSAPAEAQARASAPPRPSQPVWPPKTAEQLADYIRHSGSTFFAAYGRSHKFPVPMTAWSHSHVARAVGAFEYERDVNKSIDARGRWIKEPALS